MITYKRESFKECVGTLKGMFETHYDEVERDNKNVELDIDYDLYSLLEDNHKLCFITARDEEKIIGYSLFFLSTHPHFKEKIHAYNDAIYIDKENRKGFIGYNLLKHSLSILKESGISGVTIQTKVKHPFDTLCKRLSMDYIERVYIKNLED